MFEVYRCSNKCFYAKRFRIEYFCSALYYNLYTINNRKFAVDPSSDEDCSPLKRAKRRYERRLKYDSKKCVQRARALEKKRTFMQELRANNKTVTVRCETNSIHPWILDVYDDGPRPKMDYDTPEESQNVNALSNEQIAYVEDVSSELEVVNAEFAVSNAQHLLLSALAPCRIRWGGINLVFLDWQKYFSFQLPPSQKFSRFSNSSIGTVLLFCYDAIP